MSQDELPEVRRQFDAATGPTSATPAPDWSAVPGQALQNSPHSAGQFLENTLTPFVHPIATGQALGAIGAGLAAKIGIGNADQSAADAVGQFFKDRYGSVDALKSTLANDPIGVLSDAATVLTAGAGAAERAPGVVGDIAKAAGTVGRAIDPMTYASAVARGAMRPVGTVAANMLGLSTGTGADTIKGAVQAGRDAQTGFLEQMRDRVPFDSVVDRANDAADAMGAERNAAYRTRMADVSADKTALDFAPIDKALNDARSLAFYERGGESRVMNQPAAAAHAEISDLVGQWKQAPADYQTPEGFDALKQAIGGVREGTSPGTKARVLADRVYNAVRDQIAAQSPAYSRTMQDYANASQQLSDIQRTLSLNPGASTDTAARKLLSVSRQNVNTNFGQRQKLVDMLAKYDPALPALIFGRAMSPATPTGGARIGASALLNGGVAYGAFLHPAALPGLALSAFASSPRAVGEAAYGLGSAQRLYDNVLTPAQRRLVKQYSFQMGRAANAANGNPSK